MRPVIYRPNLQGKADPEVVRAIEHLFTVLHGKDGVVPSVQKLNQAGFITKDEAQVAFGPHATRKALSIGGSHPHNVSGLLGILSQGQFTKVDVFAQDPPINDPHSQDGVLIISGGVKKVFRQGPPPGWVNF